ncbi:TetR/AcrR family transcriptional regulator [Paradevosia shaoguanensis]|uniref:TetR/AcrR family transcriptional regulator n=1 Tax=Paradevosia shaoguanensis TaxID=1335043 RepID=UPI003C7133C6
MEHDSQTQQADTRARILHAAVEVFANRSFESATLKEITEAAGANIAAVNYYFRSKDELIRQVMASLLGRMTRARDVALTAYEKSVANDGKPGLEPLLDALIRPMVQLGLANPHGAANISLLMQARVSPAVPADLSSAEDDTIHERFIGALTRLLPQLSRKEIIWRYDCARGAMVFVLADVSPNIRQIVRLADTARQADEETIVRELIAFISQGFLASSAGTELAG